MGQTHAVGQEVRFSATSRDTGGKRLVVRIPVRGTASGWLQVRHGYATSIGDEAPPVLYREVPIVNAPDSELTEMLVEAR